MKVSKIAIAQFKKIARNELDTKTEDIIYKITRGVRLGSLLKVFGENEYIVNYGTMCFVVVRDLVTSVYRDTTLTNKVNKYEKYKYDFYYKGSSINGKYTSNYQSN